MRDTIFLMLTSGFLAMVAWMFLFWGIHLAVRNAGVADIGWALGLLILTALYSWMGPGYSVRKGAALLMVAAWSLRLAWLLLTRMIRDGKEDRRYQKLRQGWGSGFKLKFLSFFELQALLNMILSAPFLIISLNTCPFLGPVEILGISLWAAGFFGEILADEQLRRFRAQAHHQGQVCQEGLWYVSRHPNYFFEWLMWLGYAVFAMGSPWGVLALMCPAVMLFLLLKVTGIPMAEESALEARGEAYRKYQATTSVFVPWFKRKPG